MEACYITTVPKEPIIQVLLPYLEDADVVHLLMTCSHFYGGQFYIVQRETAVLRLRISETHIVPDLLIEMFLRDETIETLQRLFSFFKSLPEEKAEVYQADFFRSAHAGADLKVLLDGPLQVYEENPNFQECKQSIWQKIKNRVTRGNLTYAAVSPKKTAFKIMLHAFRYGEVERAKEIKRQWHLSSECALDRKDIYTHALEGGSIKSVEYVRTKANKINMKRIFECERNALHIAAFHGHTKLCHTLIEVDKFDPASEDETGMMMVHEPAKKGYWGCYLNLARTYHKDNLLIPTRRGLTVIHVAAKHGQFWFLLKAIAFFGDKCLNARTKKGNTVLHFGVCSLNIDVVNWLVEERNFQLDEKNNEGMTPMHQLVWYSHKLSNHKGWKFFDKLVELYGLTILEYRNKMGETVVELFPHDLKAQYQLQLKQYKNRL